MALSEGIRTRLLAVSGVTDITSQVYCGNSPQRATLPRVEIHELTTDPYVCLDGTSGLRSSTIDIDCKATSLVDSHSLAAAVEAAFNDYTGTTGAVAIKAVVLQDRSDSVEPRDTGTDRPDYVTTLDYQVQFS